MKKIMLMLVIGIVAAFGVNTATSSAASCSAGMGFTTYNAGFLNFVGSVYGCSGVSQVQQGRIVTTEGCASIPQTVGNHCATGWWDGTEYARGLNPNHPVLEAYNGNYYTMNITSSSQHQDVVWRIQPWCGGGTHNVATQFMFRIKATGGSYGPWHYSVSSAGYNIVC